MLSTRPGRHLVLPRRSRKTRSPTSFSSPFQRHPLPFTFHPDWRPGFRNSTERPPPGESMLSVSLRRPVQPTGVAADEDNAHAAALGDVDDLLLRCPAEDCYAVLGRGKSHHDVE